MKKILLSSLYAVKRKLSAVKVWFGLRLGLIKTIQILPYKGFGNTHEIYFLGRVQRDRGIGFSTISDSRWRNFVKMYKRFATWELPGLRVKAKFQGVEQIVTTDDEGYFEVRLRNEDGWQLANYWNQVELVLLDNPLRDAELVKAHNPVFIPYKDCDFGVISDIDDTIVPTGATRVFEMLKTTFFGNAHTRLPFEAVSEFYQALHRGSDDIDSNPFFYVSSSPWNLYDFLTEFLETHQIPKGPLMLRDLGLSREQLFAGSHWEHKLLQVEMIFEIESNLSFILIGDSGQHDAEIYLQVIKDYPGRVKMVYIRHINARDEEKMLKIQTQMKHLGVEMMLIKDTLEAAQDALQKGWIQESGIKDILIEQQKHGE
ncbi:App1 family protein [Belliella kenyensis]|uniref:App1 family protein n=1 Tax=Belliella kenyensis TaxID=1472724 RepID=A0ABV8ENZ6_9BACT|nr:phosphatase domain-containing protein [Belliella kenyensis]MCH7402921.1 DUF2183 domain-containing protein [Belliella kenyensis]MDN3602627.1 DUF2183 domain-containing protein [Belliella kenyensis]